MRDYRWLKFQQTWAIFGGEMAQKPPRRGHFMDAASPRKHLKIYNLTATNATLIKLTIIMYLHKIFNFAKDWGVTHVRRKPKTSENEPENRFFGSCSGAFKNKIKTVIRLMHYVALHHWSKFQMHLTTFQ